MRNVSFTNRMMLVGMLFCLVACKDNKPEAEAFRVANERLEKSNELIDHEIERLTGDFKNLLSDPATSAKAELIDVKMEQVKISSATVYNYLDSLKKKITEKAKIEVQGKKIFNENDKKVTAKILLEAEQGNKLNKQLDTLRQQLYSIDPSIMQEFSELNFGNSSRPKSNQQLSAIGNITMLSSIQNEIKVQELNVLRFLKNSIAIHIDYYNTLSTVAVVNSSYVNPGETLEVTVGLGEFNFRNKPKFIINGKEIPGKYGVSKYSFQAPNKPGNYSIDIQTSYFDNEGESKTDALRLKYTVAKKCN